MRRAHGTGTLFAVSMLLGGCAVATMTPEARTQMVDAEAAKLANVPACCRDWRDVDYTRVLGSEGTDVDFGPDSQVRDVEGGRAPVVGFRIPESARAEAIQVFSFSDARHGAFRFDNRLFVRPDLVFLDRQFATLESATDIPMCYGGLDRSGGVWYRHAIPAHAAYVVLSPSTHVPMQAVDTRILGTIPPGIQMIADARGKTYLSAVAMGYTGLVSVRAVAASAPPLGRCVEASPN